jgi:hypothetical protein
MEHTGVAALLLGDTTTSPKVSSIGYYSGIPGFDEAVTDALSPYSTVDMDMNVEEITKKVCQHMIKAGKKYQNDERMKELPSQAWAQELIEDFVTSAMTSLSTSLYDKIWLNQVDFANALMALALYHFKSAKIMSRTIRPVLKRYVDEAQARFREEERIDKIVWEILAIWVQDKNQQKKCYKHLMFAYDEAHMSAPYGSTVTTTELGWVQDFVKFWISQFVVRGWDVFVNTVGDGMQEQFQLIQGIFSGVLDPSASILPADLTTQLEALPPDGMNFVGDQIMVALTEMHENPAKRYKKGKW